MPSTPSISLVAAIEKIIKDALNDGVFAIYEEDMPIAKSLLFLLKEEIVEIPKSEWIKASTVTHPGPLSHVSFSVKNVDENDYDIQAAELVTHLKNLFDLHQNNYLAFEKAFKEEISFTMLDTPENTDPEVAKDLVVPTLFVALKDPLLENKKIIAERARAVRNLKLQDPDQTDPEKSINNIFSRAKLTQNESLNKPSSTNSSSGANPGKLKDKDPHQGIIKTLEQQAQEAEEERLRKAQFEKAKELSQEQAKKRRKSEEEKRTSETVEQRLKKLEEQRKATIDAQRQTAEEIAKRAKEKENKDSTASSQPGIISSGSVVTPPQPGPLEPPSPKSPPASTVSLSAEDAVKIRELAEHYITCLNLTAVSNYSYDHKDDYSNKIQDIWNVISKINPPDTILLSKFSAIPNPLHPPREIAHFGDLCTYYQNGVVMAMPAGSGIKTTQSLNEATNDHRITKMTFGTGTSSFDVSFTEKFRDENGVKKLISESAAIPATLDKPDDLMKWAQAIVTSFLASAKEVNQLNFEDGFTPKQLWALISYCDFMGYKYDVGPMQLMRLVTHSETNLDSDITGKFSTQKDSYHEIIKKLRNNEKIATAIPPDLSKFLLDKSNSIKPTSEMKNEFNELKWQIWTNKRVEPHIPFLGEPQLQAYLPVLNKALTATASTSLPASSPLPSSSPLSPPTSPPSGVPIQPPGSPAPQPSSSPLPSSLFTPSSSPLSPSGPYEGNSGLTNPSIPSSSINSGLPNSSSLDSSFYDPFASDDFFNFDANLIINTEHKDQEEIRPTPIPAANSSSLLNRGEEKDKHPDPNPSQPATAPSSSPLPSSRTPLPPLTINSSFQRSSFSVASTPSSTPPSSPTLSSPLSPPPWTTSSITSSLLQHSKPHTGGGSAPSSSPATPTRKMSVSRSSSRRNSESLFGRIEQSDLESPSSLPPSASAAPLTEAPQDEKEKKGTPPSMSAPLATTPQGENEKTEQTGTPLPPLINISRPHK